jgi:hypothetical protein
MLFVIQSFAAPSFENTGSEREASARLILIDGRLQIFTAPWQQ